MRGWIGTLVGLGGSLSRLSLLLLLITGALLHLVIRDRVEMMAPVFYALPVRVLWVAGVVYGLVSIRRKLHLSVSLLMILFFGYRSFLAPSGFTDLKPVQPTLAFWNMDWGQVEIASFLDYLKKTEAEVFAFVEFHEKLQEAAQSGLIESELDGYQVKLVGRGIAFVYREDLGFEPEGAKETKEYRFFRARIGSRSICVADISSDPRWDREPTMKALLEFSEGCDLVCGDFNTPYESVHFDAFREKFKSGRTGNFAGRETWPSFWPVLSLDHIFVAPRKTMVSYGTVDGWATDHFPVAVKITD